MHFHRPARSTLALLTAALALPLGAAQAATSTSATATSTTTVAQPTSETTTTGTTSSQTATSLSTSTSSTTSGPTATTTTTTQTASTHGHERWTKPGHRHRRGEDLVMHVTARAHAASDPTDTISDFKFSPATITVHVGDTITWVNNGPAPHTATANNGSFDTGNLNKGQSASHTFTQAGTFAYICKIHPFMHGTVVVLAAASSNQSSSSSAGSASSSSGSTGATSTTPTTAPVTSTGGLPNTGLNLLSAVGAGLLLAGAGIALRRRLSRG